MRPVTLADLEVAARALLAMPKAARAVAARELLAEAAAADRHRLATRRLHPHFGDGTLMAAAMQRPLAPRPATIDAAAIRVFVLLLNEIGQVMQYHGN